MVMKEAKNAIRILTPIHLRRVGHGQKNAGLRVVLELEVRSTVFPKMRHAIKT